MDPRVFAMLNGEFHQEEFTLIMRTDPSVYGMDF